MQNMLELAVAFEPHFYLQLLTIYKVVSVQGLAVTLVCMFT